MKLKILFLLCCLSISVSSVISTPTRNVPISAYPQPAVIPPYHQGLQYGDLGCCRSSYPGIHRSLHTFICFMSCSVSEFIRDK